jgi:hypothetical protein
LRCSPGRSENCAPTSVMRTLRPSGTRYRANVQPTGPVPTMRTSVVRVSGLLDIFISVPCTLLLTASPCSSLEARRWSGPSQRRHAAESSSVTPVQRPPPRVCFDAQGSPEVRSCSRRARRARLIVLSADGCAVPVLGGYRRTGIAGSLDHPRRRPQWSHGDAAQPAACTVALPRLVPVVSFTVPRVRLLPEETASRQRRQGIQPPAFQQVLLQDKSCSNVGLTPGDPAPTLRYGSFYSNRLSCQPPCVASRIPARRRRW